MGSLKVVATPPNGPMLGSVLARAAREGAYITALDDGRLAAVRSFLDDRMDAIVSFSDLVGRIQSAQGTPSRRVAKRIQLSAVVGRAASMLPEDSIVRDATNTAGGIALVVERLAELREWGFEPEDLQNAASLAEPILAGKCADLAALEVEVRARLASIGLVVGSDRLRESMASPLDMRYDPVVVLVGAREMPLAERWLQWLSEQGVAVTVMLDFAGSGADLFRVSKRIAQRLRSPSPEAKSLWIDALFTGKSADHGPQLQLASAPDISGECEYAVRECWNGISRGLMPHEIAIFARNEEVYGPLISIAARRFGLPLNSVQRIDLLSVGFARLTSNLLRAIGSSDVREIGTVARSTYLVGDAITRELLDARLREISRDPAQAWASLSEWAAERADDYPWLDRVCTWRGENLEGWASFEEWTKLLVQLISDAGIVELTARDVWTTRRDVRAQAVMLGSLNDFASVQTDPDRRFDYGSFLRMAHNLWSEETVLDEGARDGVQFVTNTARLSNYSLVVGVGMLEGAVPRRRSEDALLTDEERAELSRLTPHLPPLPNSFTRAEQERDEFARLAHASTGKLYLSYPQVDYEERDNIPSSYLEEVEKALGLALRVDYRDQPIAPPLEECRLPQDLELRTAWDGPRDEGPVRELVSEQALLAFERAMGKPLSVEAFARARLCAFRAAAEDVLEIRLHRRPSGVTIFYSALREAQLINCQTREKAEEALERACEAAIERHYYDFKPFEAPLIRSAAKRFIRKAVEAEFASREVWPRDPGSLVLPPYTTDQIRQRTTLAGSSVSLTARGLQGICRVEGRPMMLFHGHVAKLGRDTEVWDAIDRPIDEGQVDVTINLFRTMLHTDFTRGLSVQSENIERRSLFLYKVRRPRSKGTALSSHFHCVEIERPSDQEVGQGVSLPQAILSRMEAAFTNLRDTRMRPTRCVLCEKCRYGDLCRVPFLAEEDEGDD